MKGPKSQHVRKVLVVPLLLQLKRPSVRHFRLGRKREMQRNKQRKRLPHMKNKRGIISAMIITLRTRIRRGRRGIGRG